MLKTTEYVNTGVLGANASPVVVGTSGTLRIENGCTGLENHALKLAGGTLHIYNSLALPWRTMVGSMTVTADSTMRVESLMDADWTCDTELAEGTVWNLGGQTLTVLFETADTDFWIGQDKTVKPVFRNGTIYLPSQVGYWQDFGADASDHVCYRYGMYNVRQKADSSTYDLVNNIPSNANFNYNEGAMSVYGTYTPNSELAAQLKMMNGSTINLGGKSGAWAMHGGERPMTFESGATINIDFGSRKHLSGTKVISWSAKPEGVSFVDKAGRYALIPSADGLYAVCGLMLLVK